MKFAKIIFWVATIWGILILTPLYFMFDLIGRQDPPPITHTPPSITVSLAQDSHGSSPSWSSRAIPSASVP